MMPINQAKDPAINEDEFRISAPSEDGNCFLISRKTEASSLIASDEKNASKEGA